MTRATITGAAFAAGVVLLVLALVLRSDVPEPDQEPAGTPPSSASLPQADVPAAHANSGFLYGRIAVDGATYEGRLRWGGDQEGFWGDYFNGAKSENPWAVHMPQDPSSDEGFSIEVFGFEIGGNRSRGLERLFMARFGDIARIDAHFADVQVTLKSGTVISLDRFAAGDIDDGVRVWDGRSGVVDVDARRIRTIEFLPTPPLAGAPDRLHGVVRTPQGAFKGVIQWNQEDGLSTDALDARAADGELSLRYDTIRSIARHSGDSAVVALLDGREIAVSNGPDVGRSHRGIYVDDMRYGRVLISWDAFERVDLGTGGSGPAYGDFLPGRRLAGTVMTRDGREIAGRLVYDFDESETTETLDVSVRDVDYAIPFGLIASIVPSGRAGRDAEAGRVILHGGEELRVDRSGDLGERNAGMLIFVAGRERPEYVPWTEVDRIDFNRPNGAIAAGG